MVYLFYLLVGIFLLIVQTTVLPVWPFLDQSIDLLVPLVIYIGISRSHRESIPLILLLGFLVDNLSGSPLLLYMMIYFWLLIGVWLALQFFQIGTYLRLAVLVVLGVLLKHLILILFFYVYLPDFHVPPARLGTIGLQLIWAALLGPLLIAIFEHLNAALYKRLGRPTAAEAD